MADALANDVIANAFIVSQYPEIATIGALMDSLASVGRKVFVQYLEDEDHGPALECKIKEDLNGLGYKIIRKSDRITVSFP